MIQLKAKSRKDEKPNQLKEEGLIPAVVYSKGKIGTNLAVNAINFEKVYDKAGESTLVDLAMENETKKVLIHDTQSDSVSNKFLHVDFYEVDLTKKVTAPVELEFIGEAPVVKNLGGILIKQLNEVEIECLPTDLVQKIEVDVSVLDEFNSSIHIKDLKVPENITITNNETDVVVNVSEPRVEEEKPAEAEGETATEGEGEAKPEEGKAESEAKPAESGDKKPEEKK